MKGDSFDSTVVRRFKQVHGIPLCAREGFMQEDKRELRGATDEEGILAIRECDKELIPILREYVLDSGSGELPVKIGSQEGEGVVRSVHDRYPQYMQNRFIFKDLAESLWIDCG